MGITVVLQTVEDSHDTDVLQPAVLHDCLQYDFAVSINIGYLMPRHLLQERRHREDGTCRKPAADVVTAQVAHERVVGNLEDVVLQVFERRDTHHLLLRHRVTENEVSEAHVLLQQMAQVHIHLLRVLVYEVETLGLGLLTVNGLRAGQDEGHVLVPSSYFA